jgi:hypothetical protein
LRREDPAPRPATDGLRENNPPGRPDATTYIEADRLYTLLGRYRDNKNVKGAIFGMLRMHHRLFQKDPVIDISLSTELTGDDRWYGLGLFRFGPEFQWPLPMGDKVYPPNSKGAFFEMLRTMGKADRTLELGRFVESVFEFGDRNYALNLFLYGPEMGWPKEVVAKLAGDPGVQPEITKDAKGYQHIKGRKFIKGITYDDIKQGLIGDCSLLAALAAIAKRRPALLDEMIAMEENGTFTVVFYNVEKGMEIMRKATILPGFPVNSRGLVYGRSKEKTELWVSILEKAYAVLKGAQGGYRWMDEGESRSSKTSI